MIVFKDRRAVCVCVCADECAIVYGTKVISRGRLPTAQYFTDY